MTIHSLVLTQSSLITLSEFEGIWYYNQDLKVIENSPPPPLNQQICSESKTDEMRTHYHVFLFSNTTPFKIVFISNSYGKITKSLTNENVHEV